MTEIVPAGAQLDRAIELAGLIAANAPLAVRTALAGARAAERAAREAAAQHLRENMAAVLTSADAMEAVAAMVEKRQPVFGG